MNIPRPVLFACGVILLAAGAASAGGGKEGEQGEPDFPQVQRFEISELFGTEDPAAAAATGSSLIGLPVVAPDGEKLGEVTSFVVDVHTGFVPLLILSYRDLEGDRPFPMEFFIYNVKERSFMLNLVSHDFFADVPRYEELGMRDTPYRFESVWDPGLYTYWENRAVFTKVYAVDFTEIDPETAAAVGDTGGLDPGDISGSYSYLAYDTGVNVFPRSMTSFDRIKGYPVTSAGDARFGTIEDFVLNPVTGRILYAVVSSTGDAGAGTDTHTVPLSAFTLQPETGEIRYDREPNLVSGAPSIDLDKLSSSGESEGLETLSAYWSGESVALDLRVGMRVIPYINLRASYIMGFDLLAFDRSGIGTIEDLVIEENGDVKYALVGIEDFLGFTQDLTFVPLSAISLDPHTGVAMMNLDEAMAETLPVFDDRESLPDLSRQGWDGEIRSYWTGYRESLERKRQEAAGGGTAAQTGGERDGKSAGGGQAPSGGREADSGKRSAEGGGPARASSGEPQDLEAARRAYFASRLMGYVVENSLGEGIGEIEDVMLDMEKGEVAYLGLAFGGFLGLGEKLVAVPLEAVTVRPEEEKIVLDVSREQLERAEGFDGGDTWPAEADAGWTDPARNDAGGGRGASPDGGTR